jgi:hypothetical protein
VVNAWESLSLRIGYAKAVLVGVPNATKHSLNARAINDLIQGVLKNPAFNANEVDTDMLERQQAPIDSSDIQIFNMNVEGDDEQVWNCSGAQQRRSCENLWQTCAWRGISTLRFTSIRTRVATGFLQGTPIIESNGSVSFQLAQVTVGEGKLPVLYIDCTFSQ